MIVDVPFKLVIPVVMADENEKYVVVGVVIFDDGVKFAIVPATIVDKAIEVYQKLKDQGYKPIDLEPKYIIDAYQKATFEINNGLFLHIITGFYGAETLEKMNKKLAEDKSMKELIDLIKTIKEKVEKEGSMVR